MPPSPYGRVPGLGTGGLSTTWLIAAGGALATFWAQVQGSLTRLRAVFIVSATITGQGVAPFWQFCWKHFRPGKVAVRRYTAMQSYIRSEKRAGYVAFEVPGTSLTFYHGFWPIFMSVREDTSRGDDSDSRISSIPHQFRVSCLRGTFDLKQLFINSVKEWSLAMSKISKDADDLGGTKRYQVIRKFGRRSMLTGESGQPTRTTPVDNFRMALRPLGYTWDDLGAPTSDHPFKFLEYDVKVLKFREQLRRWKDAEDWYKERGIPWRIGALLHGGPGTGKTSFARATAQEMDMPVFVLDLTTMGNEDLVWAWRDALDMAPSMVLLEDLDRIFDKDKNLIPHEGMRGPGLTMDCLLNCISGVEPSEGLLVCVTANHPDRLDPSLGVPMNGSSTRPGRLDLSMKFEPLNEGCRIKLAMKILDGGNENILSTVADGEGETGAQFVKRCTDIAQEMYWRGGQNGRGDSDGQKEKAAEQSSSTT